MLDFGRNVFFVKFAVLFFLMTLFGYWGIDLNSEEVYIAFSFFFLVILAFITLRLSILSLFVGLVNSSYARIVQEGIFTAYIAKIVGVFWSFPLSIILVMIEGYRSFVLELMTVFSLRAGLLLNWGLVRFSVFRLVLEVVSKFFVISTFQFCRRATFSSVFGSVFSVEI